MHSDSKTRGSLADDDFGTLLGKEQRCTPAYALFRPPEKEC